ncbi:TPA: hypothetical protein HNC50_17285 [Escherichia coli]|nr:hypothetical protein [Escherichia coli]
MSGSALHSTSSLKDKLVKDANLHVLAGRFLTKVGKSLTNPENGFVKKINMGHLGTSWLADVSPLSLLVFTRPHQSSSLSVCLLLPVSLPLRGGLSRLSGCDFRRHNKRSTRKCQTLTLTTSSTSTVNHSKRMRTGCGT